MISSPIVKKPLLDIIEEKKEPKSPTTANKIKLFKALNPPPPGKINFTVNTSMCRSELELIQYVIYMNGFQESTLPSGGGNLIWFGLALSPKDVEMLLKRKSIPYFNRYPGLEYLARKKIFCSIVNRMRKTFPKTIKFCPRSF